MGTFTPRGSYPHTNVWTGRNKIWSDVWIDVVSPRKKTHRSISDKGYKISDLSRNMHFLCYMAVFGFEISMQLILSRQNRWSSHAELTSFAVSVNYWMNLCHFCELLNGACFVSDVLNSPQTQTFTQCMETRKCLTHDDVIKWKQSFRVTGSLWGETIGRPWIPLTKASDAELLMVALIWTIGWANNWDTGDLRRNRAHDDVTVIFWRTTYTILLWTISDIIKAVAFRVCHRYYQRLVSNVIKWSQIIMANCSYVEQTGLRLPRGSISTTWTIPVLSNVAVCVYPVLWIILYLHCNVNYISTHKYLGSWYGSFGSLQFNFSHWWLR